MKMLLVKMNNPKPVKFSWRDVEDVRDFLKKLDGVQKRTAKSKLKLP